MEEKRFLRRVSVVDGRSRLASFFSAFCLVCYNLIYLFRIEYSRETGDRICVVFCRWIAQLRLCGAREESKEGIGRVRARKTDSSALASSASCMK